MSKKNNGNDGTRLVLKVSETRNEEGLFTVSYVPEEKVEKADSSVKKRRSGRRTHFWKPRSLRGEGD